MHSVITYTETTWSYFSIGGLISLIILLIILRIILRIIRRGLGVGFLFHHHGHRRYRRYIYLDADTVRDDLLEILGYEDFEE